MKKVFAILAVAAFLTSCSDNAADAGKRTKDSLDSIAGATKNVIDSSADKAKDSIEQKVDAQKEMVDTLHKGTDTTKSKM